MSNDGSPFTSLDWNRLRNIAEGNPDETKIGAFGVGFYSVFSDCDEPLVISGNETMAFYWKGNALFTKKGKIPSRQVNSDTAFILDYRGSDSPVPRLFSLCQFLSTSLTFVALERIELWLDNWNLMKLSKKLAPAVSISLPKDIDPKTQGRLMRVASLTNRSGQIDANFLNVVGWTPCQKVTKKQEPPTTHSGFRDFLSRVANSALKVKTASGEAAREEEALQQAISDDLLGSSKATIFIRLTIAGIQTDCRKCLAQELERATKKAPPSQTCVSILTSPYEEQSASISAVSGSASKRARSLFTSVLPKEGRLFIGFRTAQTTGFEAHVSAPSLIPTVERENIDLSAKHVSTWNIELLRAVGIVLRIGYSLEYSSLQYMLSLSKKSEGPDVTEGAVSPTSAAVHTIKCYTKRESTPSSLVADLIDEAFWGANRQYVEVLSSNGVLPSNQVRITAEPLPFLTTIPILHSTIRGENSVFFQTLYDKGMINDVTLKDIKDDLGSKTLGETQVELFMKWAAAKTVSMEIDLEGLRNLFSVVIVTLNSPRLGTTQGTVLPLADVISFVNNSGIPPDCPMPPSTAPFSLTKSLSRHQLLAFGWKEVEFTEWIHFLISSSSRLPESCRLESSPDFAVKVLKALSKSWDASSKENLEIVDFLSSRTVIPTTQGMKKPSAAYFPTVRLFDDLPVIKGLQGVKEKLLLALGVRKTIELSVVFSRLMNGQNKTGGNNVSKNAWSHIDLIKYLSSVRGDIPPSDIERLRQIRIWPSEKIKSEDDSKALYKMSELYQPTNEVRSLHLPVLEWHGNFRAESNEGVFLYTLGLQKFPSVIQLIDLMTEARVKKDTALWDLSMGYFLNNYHKHSYSSFDISKISHKRIVPLAGRPFPDLSTPADCFTNDYASILGYNILRQDLHSHAHKLGVREDPPIEMVANRVINMPTTKYAEARLIFEYLSGRLQEIGPSITELLGNSSIVPVKDLGGSDVSSNKTSVRHAIPKMCFLGDPTIYGKILDFVDFGTQGNAFLVKVGAGREPGVLDLAQILAIRPRKLLDTLGEHKYLDLLRKLAENITLLRAQATLWEKLRNTATLLGYRDILNPIRTSSTDGSAELEEKEKLQQETSDDDDMLIREWSLSHPYSLAVVDSIEDFTIFQKSLLTAPQEEKLETLYLALGTPYLSSLVKSVRRVGPTQKDQSPAKKVHRLIMERCRIFLHDHASNEIKHDMKWLDRYLRVETVEYILLQKKLIAHGATHSEKVTACLDKNSISRMYVLSITHNYDLYEVSQALIQELLKRHKHQDIMALEVILGSDLRKLKIRGYNVDRILRQRELESRIAADKKQRLQEEQVREHKAAQEYEAESTTANETTSNDIPGTFKIEPLNDSIASENSTEKSKSEIKSNRYAGKFMSDLTKRLGLNETWDRNSTKLVENPKEPSTTKPEALNQNLMSAIQSARSYNSNSIFSTPRTTMIPEAEKGAYCDSSEGHDLVFCNVVLNDVKVFVTRQETAQVHFIQSQTVALGQFASLLLACAEVFELERTSLNIFHSTHTKSIAFNYKGSLFCNFHFFSKLHQAGFAEAENRSEAIIYWFVVLCHELAHNLVKTHDSKHSYYTESFVQKYFSKMARVAAQI